MFFRTQAKSLFKKLFSAMVVEVVTILVSAALACFL